MRAYDLVLLWKWVTFEKWKKWDELVDFWAISGVVKWLRFICITKLLCDICKWFVDVIEHECFILVNYLKIGIFNNIDELCENEVYDRTTCKLLWVHDNMMNWLVSNILVIMKWWIIRLLCDYDIWSKVVSM